MAVISLIATLALLSGMLITFAAHGPAGSHLVAHGPIHPNNGYPMWYKDSTGLMLELCTDPNFCGFLPGDIPDPAMPIHFPKNFPQEAFYWLGEAIMPNATPNNGLAIITMGLEAAFANDEVIPGEQIVFGRIRIRVDNLVAGGTYTVTHPYGVDVFDNIGPDAGPGTAAGPGISYVEDIGIGALGDFNGALHSRIGPFLTGDPATAPPSPAGFIGDGGLLNMYQVVGSPFGTNFFRIEGPNVGAPGSEFLCADPTLGPDPVATTDCIETDLFTLLGKIATNFGVGADMVTYAQSAGGSGSIDIFANSVPGEVIQASGTDIGTLTLAGDLQGRYFGRIDYAGAPPASITLENLTDTPPTLITAAVVDMVTITRADYNSLTGELTVKAVSSDEAVIPALTAVGFGPLVQTAGSLVQNAVFTGVSVPPVSLTVTSAAGGSDTEPVAVVYFNRGPVAVDDSVVVTAGTGTAVLDILANDTDADGFIDPATVVAVTLPVNGTLTVDGATGAANYTPNPGYLGPDSFTYTVNDNAGATSNVATVSISVAPATNSPPVANNDTAATTEDVPVIIAGALLLANDSDPDGDTVTIAAVDAASANGGVITDNSDGTYTYTPAANFNGTDSFTYTAADNNGGAAAGTVTVTVTAVNDPPTAVNDAFSTDLVTPLVISAAQLLANDTDVDTGDVLTVLSTDFYSAKALELIAEGKNPLPIIDNGDGTYTYTPPDPFFIGLDFFNYVISDGSGAVATGTVTINIIAPVTDNITVTQADYKSAKGEWRIAGTGSDVGSILTIYVGSTPGGLVIGQAEVLPRNKWQFQAKGLSLNLGGATTISVVSSGGGSVLGYPLALK
ncbi:MAG: tandem-95 repeat protein [Anaerolineae bacterium]